MDTKKSFVIDRSTWLRGARSCLRDADGMQCCLGFYLKACNLSNEAIEGTGSPEGVQGEEKEKVPPWLLQGGGNSDACHELINANDENYKEEGETDVMHEEEEEEREARIKKLFADQDIEVTFVD